MRSRGVVRKEALIAKVLEGCLCSRLLKQFYSVLNQSRFIREKDERGELKKKFLIFLLK